MIKYLDKAIVLQEIPDEICLALDITNCPHKCKNCHSPYLRADIGTPLDYSTLISLSKTRGISCILFMGGDSHHKSIEQLADIIHKETKLKVAMYSGDDEIDKNLLHCLDYYKVGSYKEDLGALNKRTTNQRLYKILDKDDCLFEDITYMFWRKPNIKD
jgi:anaerobic ribonucleoside-triphosphate reductase activating protein